MMKLATRAWWVIFTVFGKPVVPEEEKRMASVVVGSNSWLI